MDQQGKLKMILSRLDLGYDRLTVLEIGCGNGRLTSEVMDTLIINEYVCIDSSEESIEEISSREEIRNGATVVQFFTIPFEKVTLMKSIIFASHVLMHIDEDKIEEFMRRMIESGTKYIIHVDWYSELDNKSNNQYVEHDYEQLWINLGYEAEVTKTLGGYAVFVIKL